MILITTSRRPTNRIRTLCKDLRRVIPDSIRINRGGLNVKGLYEEAIELHADRIIVLERWKGGPGRIKLSFSPFTTEDSLTLPILGVKTQDDIGRRTKISKGLFITFGLDSSHKVKHLASFLSRFLNAPYFENIPNGIGFKASLHLSELRKDEIKISFKKSPNYDEMGPILIVKNSADNHIGEPKS